MLKSLKDNTELIEAEGSNLCLEDEAKAHYSINFSVSEPSLELARHFHRRHGLIESQLSAEINHFSHKHPLTLSINHEEDVKVLKNEETLICDGCIRPKSGSYYCCNECNYSLQAYCAQLPYEIQHPCHSQHSLVLSKPVGYELCSFCSVGFNGFLYKCKKNCGFYLDVHCAMLYAGSFIMHEAHCHQLVLNKFEGEFLCIACRGVIYGGALSCDDCNFHLHSGCALLPRYARHVKDKHRLTLILSCHSFSQHRKVIYCGFCKQKIYTVCWFYYCSECNQSFHPGCIPEALEQFRIIKYGGIFQVLNHPHPLKCVQKDVFHCDQCDNGLRFAMAFGCEPCGYFNCVACVKRSIGENKLVEGTAEEAST